METERSIERLRLSGCKRPAVTYGTDADTREMSKYRVIINTIINFIHFWISVNT
jgi:hypothetical protein